MSSGIVRRLLASGLLAVIVPVPALAATVVTTLEVRVTITAECKFGSGTGLDFGTAGVVDANIDASTTFNVQCTNGTPYDVALGFGTNAGGSLASRLLTGPSSATLNYNIYKDLLHTAVWGNVSSGDTVAGTGTGATQVFNVYGRIPAQTTPAAGAYADTVAVTITY